MKRVLVATAVAVLAVVVPATAASAHPLGNFTVNHYDGLTFSPTRVTDLAVVDSAEIPTAQARGDVDHDGNGTVTDIERARYARAQCVAVAASLRLTVDGRSAPLVLGASAYGYAPGAAGLQTSRLTCQLSAGADLSQQRQVAFADSWSQHRIGWREITATAAGVHLRASPVPQQSISNELRHYPNDLLGAPLDVRSATFDVQPGAGLSTIARGIAKVPGAGPIARAVEALNRAFAGLAGSRHLTLAVGLLAVAVSLLLGAAHAALPGHGKTVIAAYLAGRHGRPRDAVLVGATVTVTHTAGVIVLGLALTASSSLAGERVTTVLGAASGALIALVGITLLAGAIRRRSAVYDDHDHSHEHGHDHEHTHDHRHDHPHPHPHPHPHREQSHSHSPAPLRRAGLVGMGIAGGLVPSPSALVVLLGAIALGRTAFGVLLVIGYGVGMAATLTAVGLALVRFADRVNSSRGRLRRISMRIARRAPAATASLIVLVGVGLTARSLVAI